MIPVPLFTSDDLDAANAAWGFNCGPSALAVIAGLKPEQLRPHLGDFERKGYTNPTLMFAALRSLGLRYTLVRLVEGQVIWPRHGLARVQWSGPWCAPGVPYGARYRRTHWVACHHDPSFGTCIHDINAMHERCNGWLDEYTWSAKLVPALLRACEPKADGEFWVTHTIEVLG
jgi:hypothetical protein